MGEKRSLQLLLYSSNQIFKALLPRKNPKAKVVWKIPVGPWLHLWVPTDQQHLLQHSSGHKLPAHEAFHQIVQVTLEGIKPSSR